MARKTTSVFVCSECGASSTRWEGRCRECGQWNTLVEEKIQNAPGGRASAGLGPSTRERARAAPLKNLQEQDVSQLARVPSGFSEVDRVLGGGFVKGSILLFGGEPGIGKSTMLLQVIGAVSAGLKTLYVSGEESAAQVAARAKRLGIELTENLHFLGTSSLDEALESVDELKPDLVVVDSVQTLSSPSLESSAGTVSQVREVTQQLLVRAKSGGPIVLLVGHVTKDGQIAGPRLLEHMVDGVFYFELASSGGYRLLRGQKNRFGATHELAVLEMGSTGLVEVPNPSARFLAERTTGLAGSAVVAHLEGTRPFLTEVQALTQKCHVGYPRRTVQGVDQNRVAVLLAIVEKRLGVTVSDLDVYCKVSSGARIEEPAADLALLFAIASAATGKVIPPDMILIGEVGLGGEVRSVPGVAPRLSEAKAVGLTRAMIPAANERDAREVSGIKIAKVKSIQDVARALEII